MKTAPLTSDQLAAATLSLVGNYEPTRVPRSELTQMFAAFLKPLTSDGIKPEHVSALITAANDAYYCWGNSQNPMESDRAGWAEDAAKAERRVQVVAAAICDGGRPE
jgi:hypothetical protein